MPRRPQPPGLAHGLNSADINQLFHPHFAPEGFMQGLEDLLDDGDEEDAESWVGSAEDWFFAPEEEEADD